MSLFSKYNKLLLKRPFITNVLTTGFLFGSGDYLAQEMYTKDKKSYDYARTARAVIYGGLCFSPVGDKWYKILNKVQFFKSSKANTVAKVALDQLGFAPFVGIPMYYSVMSILEMSPNPVEQVQTNLSRHWWDTLKVNWVLWPAFQTFNFYLIPVQFRLLSVNVISIAWNCYLSYTLNSNESLVEVEEEQIMV